MKIAVAGGLGFIGKHIISELINRGHNVTLFARRDEGRQPGVGFVYADLMVPGEWQGSIAKSDVVINLVGVNLFQRWDSKIRKLIYDSRIISTANIVDAFAGNRSKSRLLINASAVGFYGSCGDEVITESFGPGNDYLSKICSDWESEALKGESNNLRVVLLRFGSVFGSSDGAFPVLVKNFRMMLSGKLGSGRQWFPWIHIDDAVGIVIKAISDKKMKGAYNCTAPGIVTNGEFTITMANAVRRPVIIPFIPEFVLRLALGEFGSFLTKGQRAVPARLLKEKYHFRFPDLDKALTDLLRR